MWWAYHSEDDVGVLATVLLFGIVNNHPFQQGNKRTGLTAAEVFLYINGYELTAPDSDLLADAILAVIKGEEPEEEFMNLMRFYVQPIGNWVAY